MLKATTAWSASLPHAQSLRLPVALWTGLLLALSCAAGQPAARPGTDLQRLVDEEVAGLARQRGAGLALAVVLEPSGRVLAMGGQRGEVVDRALPERLEIDPGSVMKTFTIGAALEAGLVTPATRVEGEGGEWTFGHRTMRDVEPHSSLSVEDALVFSSNVGTAKVYALLGHQRLEATLKALGLPCPSLADDEAGVGVSFGADVTPTPLQVARAYAAIASGRAFPRANAALIGLLQRTVDRDNGTGKGARLPGVTVAGKTGSWRTGDGPAYGNFVGFFPAGAPRYVVLVGVETSEESYPGGSVAAPAFARMAAQLAR